MGVPTIGFHLRCIRCGYDLRGLAATSRCPECGTAAMASLVEADDPLARRFAALAQPARTARSILMVAAGLLFAWNGSMCAAVLMDLALRGSVDPEATRAAGAGGLLGALGGLAAMVGAIALARIRDPLLEAESPRARKHLLVGSIVSMAATAATFLVLLLAADPNAAGGDSRAVAWTLATRALLILGFAWTTLALRPLLGALGRRSRQYSRGRHAVQGTELLVGSMGLLLATSTAGSILAKEGWIKWDLVASLSDLVSAILVVLITIGLAYLVLNSWWISRSLAFQHPELDQR